MNLPSLARKPRALDNWVSRMVDQDEAETARCRRRSRRVLLVIAALPVLATMLIAGVYFWGMATFTTQRTFENNWGVVIPVGLKIVEYHAEESFHGDGVRLTVFDVEDPASIEGTFFDPGLMSSEALTQEDTALIDLVNRTFRPENRVALPNPQLLKADRQRYENRLLSVYEPTGNRFYVFEDLL